MSFTFSWYQWVPKLHQEIKRFITVDAQSYDEAYAFVDNYAKKRTRDIYWEQMENEEEIY